MFGPHSSHGAGDFRFLSPNRGTTYPNRGTFVPRAGYRFAPLGRSAAPGRCPGPLGRSAGPGRCPGPLGRSAGPGRCPGPLGRSAGPGRCPGPLGRSAGPGRCPGPLAGLESNPQTKKPRGAYRTKPICPPRCFPAFGAGSTVKFSSHYSMPQALKNAALSTASRADSSRAICPAMAPGMPPARMYPARIAARVE